MEVRVNQNIEVVALEADLIAKFGMYIRLYLDSELQKYADALLNMSEEDDQMDTDVRNKAKRARKRSETPLSDKDRRSAEETSDSRRRKCKKTSNKST